MTKFSLAGDFDLEAILARMQRDINTLKRSTRAVATSIDNGNLDVFNGAIRAHHEDGSQAVYFGRFYFRTGDDMLIDAGAGLQVQGNLELNSEPFFQVYQYEFPNSSGPPEPRIMLGTSLRSVNLLEVYAHQWQAHITPDPNWPEALGNISFSTEAGAIAFNSGQDIHANAVGTTFLGGEEGTGVVLRKGTGNVWIQHNTTSAGANCVIETTGTIQRSTSSRRYKQDIEDAVVDLKAVLKMRPRTWRDKRQVEEDPNTDKHYIGYVAEELDELGLKQFILYDEEGRPDAISYDRLVVGAIEVIKDLASQVDELRQMVESLANKEDMT